MLSIHSAHKDTVLRIALATLIVLAIVILAALFGMYKAKSPVADINLSAAAVAAYAEARGIANQGDSNAAIAQIEQQLANIPAGNTDANSVYTRAKLSIYKADITLTYGGNAQEGFALLSNVYAETKNNDAMRGEALMVAMAQALQSLDEGRFTAAQIRDYVLLNENFKATLESDAGVAAAVQTAADTYPYLTRGFAAAMKLNTTERVAGLSKTYTLRLAAPAIAPPPTGGYYHSFVAALESAEEWLGVVVKEYTSEQAPYQEFITTSYYNLALAYEALPQSDVDTLVGMTRMHNKLAAYVAAYPDVSVGTSAYLTGISTRLVCKTITEANFDATRVNKDALQPYLDEIYSTDGWVASCRDAFEVVSKKIDTRFAKFF